jgi:ArsR family transcriptional regulator, arsenate/arsenite/antimonite-responsive transcriptional repressor
LVAKGELCVCDFTGALNMIQPKISRHLAILKKYNAVIDRRSGVWIYYRINPQLPKWMQKILSSTMKESIDIKPYSLDFKALNTGMECSTC